jgi:hypothetical protein
MALAMSLCHVALLLLSGFAELTLAAKEGDLFRTVSGMTGHFPVHQRRRMRKILNQIDDRLLALLERMAACR